MKKSIVILLTILMLPLAFAIRTGVVVDVQGKVYSGCVDVSAGKSAYDVLKGFDDIESGVDMKFDGVLTGTPFLQSIDGIKGESVPDNGYSGWNFWIMGDDEFITPPELAPGWGAGIGDYKIEKQDIIAINFATTYYNADFTVKTPPAKPDFIQYAELCNMEVTEVTSKVDGDKEYINTKGDSFDIKPGSKVKLQLTIKNHYTDDTEIKDVKVKADIDDLDISEESDEDDIRAGDDSNFDINFDIPLDLDDNDYDLELLITGKDSNGNRYEQTLEYTLVVDKERHEIVIELVDLSPQTLTCNNNAELDLALINTGEEDEDIKIEITSSQLGIDEERDISLDEEDSTKESFSLDIIDTKPGTYPIDIEVKYHGDSTTESIDLIKKACDTKEKEETAQLGAKQDTKVAETIENQVDKETATTSQAQRIISIPNIKEEGSVSAAAITLIALITGILVSIIAIVILKNK